MQRLKYNCIDKLFEVIWVSYNTLLAFAFLAILMFIVIRILLGPLKVLFKILYSCIIGALGIFIFNFIGNILGLHIGLNIITILTVGLLGLPGLALILFLKIIFKV